MNPKVSESLTPVEEAVQSILADRPRRIKSMLAYVIKETNDQIARIRKNRGVLPALENLLQMRVELIAQTGARYDVFLPDQPPAGHKRLREEWNLQYLTRIRNILGSPIKEDKWCRQATPDGKKVKTTFSSADYPGIQFHFLTHPPKEVEGENGEEKAKCRMVKEVTYKLVCDL